MADVVTDKRFGMGADELERMRAQGIVVVSRDAGPPDLSDLALSEPAYGEEKAGVLTHEEAAVFRDLYAINNEIEAQTRDLIGKSLTKAGAAIRNADRSRALHDVLTSGDLATAFDSEEEGRAYFRLQQRASALHATFYWMLGERLGAHDWRLGVRSGARVVKVQRRY